MPANQPPPPSAQPPPDVPGTWSPDTGINYLRQFALWCRRGFQSKVDIGVAQQSVFLFESGVQGIPRVYELTVVVTAGTPAIVLTQVNLGAGQP